MSLNTIPEFFKKDYPLTALNRINTEGKTLFYAHTNSLQDLKQTLIFSKENSLPFYLLVNGSNVLINDNKFQGIVITLGQDFKSISFDYNNKKITAGAGVPLMKLGTEIAEHGHSGYTYMGVIPGTVGGATTMNAGINHDEKIQNHFLSAQILDPETLKEEEYSPEKLNFNYRKSTVRGTNKIIINCTFTLPEKKERPGEAAINELKQLLDLRHQKQPKNNRTFGSTFKNPEKSEHSAGWLLEKTGMKGLQEGDARVSSEHANWIINTGQAKSSDIKALIETGQKRVFEAFGISLEREVIFLPEDIIKP